MHLTRAVEAVAAGFATGALGEDLAVDHLLAEQHHQPLGRTDELFLACGPAHALGNRQVVQRSLDDTRQQLGGGLTFDGAAEPELGPAAVDFGRSTPHLRAKPVAAWVGSPWASKAACIGGPSRLMLRSGCWVASCSTSTARRRGAA